MKKTTKIEELGLSVRVFVTLNRAGLNTAGDIDCYTQKGLMEKFGLTKEQAKEAKSKAK